MAIEVKISLFEDLINLLKEIEHWNKTKKLKKLRKSYARIYVLMNELQDSNKNFLGWLKHSDDFNFLAGLMSCSNYRTAHKTNTYGSL